MLDHCAGCRPELRRACSAQRLSLRNPAIFAFCSPDPKQKNRVQKAGSSQRPWRLKLSSANGLPLPSRSRQAELALAKIASRPRPHTRSTFNFRSSCACARTSFHTCPGTHSNTTGGPISRGILAVGELRVSVWKAGGKLPCREHPVHPLVGGVSDGDLPKYRRQSRLPQNQKYPGPMKV